MRGPLDKRKPGRRERCDQTAVRTARLPRSLLQAPPGQSFDRAKDGQRAENHASAAAERRVADLPETPVRKVAEIRDFDGMPLPSRELHRMRGQIALKKLRRNAQKNQSQRIASSMAASSEISRFQSA